VFGYAGIWSYILALTSQHTMQRAKGHRDIGEPFADMREQTQLSKGLIERGDRTDSVIHSRSKWTRSRSSTTQKKLARGWRSRFIGSSYDGEGAPPQAAQSSYNDK